jgi:peptide/nickel transport system permease protein
MRWFILRRLLIAIPILFGVSIVTFTFANLAPGDPVSALVRQGSADLRPGDLAELKRQLGLDRPWFDRYVVWIGLQPVVAVFTGEHPVPGLLEGNLGVSFVNGQSVAKTLASRIPNTLILMGTALVLSVVLGVTLGVFSAFRQGTRVDNVLTAVVFAGISLPSYLVALLVVVAFAVLPYQATGIKFFPATGIVDPLSTAPKILDLLYHLALPALVLAFGGTATFLRYTRSSVLEVMRQDHVTTARSKGLVERSVRFRHILRNALLPVVTVIGLSLPSLITGALFVETLFVWPGVGSLAIQSTQVRDYPMIMAIALLTSVTIILANLLTDIAYAYVDPRIRYT